MADHSARLVARFDGWTLRRTPLELFRGDQPVRLQEQPLQILEALVQARGALVTREALAARLWPDTVVDVDAGLNTAVRKLRAALADDAEAPKYLETVPRQGYRFVGRMEPVGDGLPVDPPPAVTPPAPSWPRRRTLVVLGLAGVVAAIAMAVVMVRPASVPAAGGGLLPRPDRLAVLPFENLSPDPANAFFADGMHEELLSELGNGARKLEVISRTTMLTYRGRPTDVRALARDLGATHVVEGSVRREANTVRVSLQLVDAAADRQLWSRSYQSTLVDAMTLQARIAREVAGQLAIQLSAARAGHVPPPRSPEAYDEWLKGTLAWQGVGGGGATAQEIDRVEAMFTRAIALDATYGAAYADRARVRIARYASHADGREANLAGARADIALAQQYAGGTPYVLVRAAGLVFLVDRDLPRALGLIEAAEQVGPLDAGLLLTKGNFLMSAGRLEESLAVQREAARLDPGNAGIYRYWVSNLAGARRPAEAIRCCGISIRAIRGGCTAASTSSASPARRLAGGTRSRGCGPAESRTRPCRLNSTCCAASGDSPSCTRASTPSGCRRSRSTVRSAAASGRASSRLRSCAVGSGCWRVTPRPPRGRVGRSPRSSTACRRRPGTPGGVSCSAQRVPSCSGSTPAPSRWPERPRTRRQGRSPSHSRSTSA